MEEPTNKGFLESAEGRKSSNRLTLIICAAICVFATIIEGGSMLISVVKDSAVIHQANWTEITYLVGVLLMGSGVIKAAQSLTINKTK